MTKFRFRLKGGYVIGSLRIPTECGAVNVQAVGGTKAEALMRAATIAQRIAEDPVMRALMPPQARAAIVAAKVLSVAARQGPAHLRRLWRHMKGPGKKRLAAALVEEAQKAEVSGIRYQTSYGGVKHTNRGAWQEWQDPEHEYDGDDADEYEDDYGVSGIRSKAKWAIPGYAAYRTAKAIKRRRKRRKERKEREREGREEEPADNEQEPEGEQSQEPEGDPSQEGAP